MLFKDLRVGMTIQDMEDEEILTIIELEEKNGLIFIRTEEYNTTVQKNGFTAFDYGEPHQRLIDRDIRIIQSFDLGL